MTKKTATIEAPVAPDAATLQAQCGAKVWQRGVELKSSRALSDLVRAGNELFGRCGGSEFEPYHLHAQRKEGGAFEAHCSCPFDGGGWCKHLVALFLRYAETPGDFEVTPPIGEIVSALNREELNALVEGWVRRSPELLGALTLNFKLKAGADDDDATQPLRSTLRRALGGSDAEQARPALEIAVNQANRCETKGDWAGAAEIWRALLEETVAAVPRFEAIIEGEDEDDGGWHREYEEIDTGEVWAELAVVGLNRALEETLTPAQSESLLRALWQAWSKARHFSYFGLPEETLDRVLDDAPPALWKEIEADVLRRLQSGNTNDYQREDLVETLTHGLQQRDQAARAQALLREHGSYRQRLALLMAEKNYAAAQELALRNESAHTPSLLDVATDLDKAGQSELALNLALRAQRRTANYHALPATQWLAQFYIRQKQSAPAQREATALFVARPDAASLQLWKAAVALDGDWDKLYSELESAPGMTPLARVKLAILDGRAARALELYQTLDKREKPGVIEAVAQVCQADLPERAAELYQQMGERALAQFQQGYGNARAAYASAAGYWKRAHELHRTLGSLDEWSEYIGDLRQQNKRRPAFLDELKKAGL